MMTAVVRVRPVHLQTQYPVATNPQPTQPTWAVSLSTIHTCPGQLSLLPSAGQDMRTSHSAVMLCGWGVQVWFIPLVDKRAGGR